MNEIIQGLWIGTALSVMERLSVSSFLKNGHEYHLYVYDDLKHVPEKTVIKDANEILPASMIFEYKHSKSYAGFANFFRYKLLLERGGWWVDTDVVCLKPFDFQDEYVFASEKIDDNQFVNNGIIKAPAASEIMSYCEQVCAAKDNDNLAWGETGPRLLTQAVRRFSLGSYVTGHQVFCPFGYLEWQKALDAANGFAFDQSTYAVHLWNEMWRRDDKDKDAFYDPYCLYEQLKRKYLN
ncbi:MAG TPA: glycosyltransferase [Blastocatellia bacterium]|jgi:mannosyltransferase OCH1-like enzyme